MDNFRWRWRLIYARSDWHMIETDYGKRDYTIFQICFLAHKMQLSTLRSIELPNMTDGILYVRKGQEIINGWLKLNFCDLKLTQSGISRGTYFQKISKFQWNHEHEMLLRPPKYMIFIILWIKLSFNFRYNSRVTFTNADLDCKRRLGAGISFEVLFTFRKP